MEMNGKKMQTRDVTVILTGALLHHKETLVF